MLGSPVAAQGALSLPLPRPAAHPIWLTIGLKRNLFVETLIWEQPESNLDLQSRPPPTLPVQDDFKR